MTLSGCQTENQQHSQSAHSPLIHAQNSADNKSDNRTKQVNYSYGSRPFYLIDDMDDSPLKQELQACEAQTPKKTDFSISHRGAPLQYPEHTLDGYMAAARMGAGVLECDVAFTKDHELVCRHAQNDLHTTTNILTTPLANQCTQPPKFDAMGNLTNASDIECRTSDISLAEFKSLHGKMDAADKKATSLTDYMNATPTWRTELYNQNAQLLSLDEHIALAKSLGLKHTPELKAPSVDMPHIGSDGKPYTQADYRQQLINAYRRAGVAPDDVFAQSFQLSDVLAWQQHDPEFGKNAVYLIDDSNETADNQTFNKDDPSTWKHSPQQLKAMGVNIIAPATWLLVSSDGQGKLKPSTYAMQAKAAGLDMITWSLERSGPLANGGGWYYTGLEDAINNDGDMYNYIDVLAQQVGVKGIFSDWPTTVTYYANCKGL
ncbi:glycerophosphodiester phosphodiesterase [Psychrobacter sp. FDAARGOS_221]|nr:glycerophosphodiester phosphodiesterase [Psychrobacter sp. FDAARGOS_221]